MRNILIAIISLYQSHLSPYKGFSCAYGALHQEGSCSVKIKSIIKHSPRKHIISEMSAQFKACKKAHLTLSSQKENEDNKKGHYWYFCGECGFWSCLGIFS